MPPPPNPGKILRSIHAHWESAIVGTAAEHGVFDAIEAGRSSCSEIAEACRISPRGAQALLDGLAGLGLVSRKDGGYRNAPEASAFLVSGAGMNLAPMARHALAAMRDWALLPEAVSTGKPVVRTRNDDPFWPAVATAIASFAMRTAERVAAELAIAARPSFEALDVGGGRGAYASVFLKANPSGRMTQVDWPSVNREAEAFARESAIAERFATIDGDYLEVDFDDRAYDIAILSNVAHQEPPERVKALLGKLRRAVRPGGTLVISEFVLDDDRSGGRVETMFHCNMLLHTTGGAPWRLCDYDAWLHDAGFSEITVDRQLERASLLYAR